MSDLDWPSGYPSDLPKLTCAELDALLVSLAESIQADIEAYEERLALQAIDDGLTTDERAYKVLQRPERFPGEHAVATAWLKHHAVRIWSDL